jgi:hypothetical protein
VTRHLAHVIEAVVWARDDGSASLRCSCSLVVTALGNEALADAYRRHLRSARRGTGPRPQPTRATTSPKFTFPIGRGRHLEHRDRDAREPLPGAGEVRKALVRVAGR